MFMLHVSISNCPLHLMLGLYLIICFCNSGGQSAVLSKSKLKSVERNTLLRNARAKTKLDTTRYASGVRIVPGADARETSNSTKLELKVDHRVTPRNMTVFFTGVFNISATVLLHGNESFLYPNRTLRPVAKIPWQLSSAFNFSASHGPVTAAFGGGLGAGGSGRAGGGGGQRNGVGGAGAGCGGSAGSGGGIGLGGALEFDGKRLVGFGGSDSFAAHGGGGAAVGGIHGGFASAGGTRGNSTSRTIACSSPDIHPESLQIGSRKKVPYSFVNSALLGQNFSVSRITGRNSGGFGFADGQGAGSSSSAGSGKGTWSRSRSFGFGTTYRGTTEARALGFGNAGAASSGSGGPGGGMGWTTLRSNRNFSSRGVSVGIARANGTSLGGGSVAAASRDSNASSTHEAWYIEENGVVAEDKEESEDGKTIHMTTPGRNKRCCRAWLRE